VHDQRHVLCKKNALDNDLNKIETCQVLKNEVFMTSGGDGG
jgi:hypothetical protein